jgi:hypothetical protein
MSKPFAIAFGVAAIIIIALVWTGFEKTAGNHLVPVGSIGKVRTIGTSDDTTLMVIDFNLKNDSDRNMVVRSVTGTVTTADGASLVGDLVAAADLGIVFNQYPLLGQQYNPVLKVRDVIAPHQMVDRMVAINLHGPSAKIDGRKRVTLEIEDITGPTAVLTK